LMAVGMNEGRSSDGWVSNHANHTFHPFEQRGLCLGQQIAAGLGFASIFQLGFKPDNLRRGGLDCVLIAHFLDCPDGLQDMHRQGAHCIATRTPAHRHGVNPA
jgi:hypothetical protein